MNIETFNWTSGAFQRSNDQLKLHEPTNLLMFLHIEMPYTETETIKSHSYFFQSWHLATPTHLIVFSFHCKIPISIASIQKVDIYLFL